MLSFLFQIGASLSNYFDDFDLILTMDADRQRDIEGRAPRAHAHKVLPFRTFDPEGGPDDDVAPLTVHAENAEACTFWFVRAENLAAAHAENSDSLPPLQVLLLQQAKRHHRILWGTPPNKLGHIMNVACAIGKPL